MTVQRDRSRSDLVVQVFLGIMVMGIVVSVVLLSLQMYDQITSLAPWMSVGGHQIHVWSLVIGAVLGSAFGGVTVVVRRV